MRVSASLDAALARRPRDMFALARKGTSSYVRGDEAATRLTNLIGRPCRCADRLPNPRARSAAEKDGEFLVPLSDERISALRQSVRIHRDNLDNNFLVSSRPDQAPPNASLV